MNLVRKWRPGAEHEAEIATSAERISMQHERVKLPSQGRFRFFLFSKKLHFEEDTVAVGSKNLL